MLVNAKFAQLDINLIRLILDVLLAILDSFLIMEKSVKPVSPAMPLQILVLVSVCLVLLDMVIPQILPSAVHVLQVLLRMLVRLVLHVYLATYQSLGDHVSLVPKDMEILIILMLPRFVGLVQLVPVRNMEENVLGVKKEKFHTVEVSVSLVALVFNPLPIKQFVYLVHKENFPRMVHLVFLVSKGTLQHPQEQLSVLPVLLASLPIPTEPLVLHAKRDIVQSLEERVPNVKTEQQREVEDYVKNAQRVTEIHTLCLVLAYLVHWVTAPCLVEFV